MSDTVKIAFAPFSAPDAGALVVFCAADLKMGAKTAAHVAGAAGFLRDAAETLAFKGKGSSAMDLVRPASLSVERLLVVGAEPKGEGIDFVQLGGYVAGRLPKAKVVHVLFEAPEGEWGASAAADFALGFRLRSYKFDKYKTRKADNDEGDKTAPEVTILVADPEAARGAHAHREPVAEGVEIARTLVNEPPNVLYPETFAEHAEALEKLGVDVEVLDEKAMAKLGMGALLAVGRGSTRPSRFVAMRWKGAKSKKAAPVAIVGKGVCFDSGGISIKPAASMEDMKGDMAGAACVVGLMHALAKRKAKANVVGVIGLVENMPGGESYRPGDILTSMSGQTIEVVNTDAEGRLVLADALWWTKETVKPKLMVNLATLTGAILVALGVENAGLFSNDDELSTRLFEAGKATGETVWRMPMGPAYDKLIDSKFADMKNSGGRHAGSITAAHFLKRFVGDIPWAHLDIAGTAMASPATETNTSWGSGWGVRLLDRLVADHYEER
ncbi:MAG: leucyl aminopeptidase [Pseudomonadota bacterium]|nr:leucyl aminopeptidase [Pseudomonadota bacterium]